MPNKYQIRLSNYSDNKYGPQVYFPELKKELTMDVFDVDSGDFVETFNIDLVEIEGVRDAVEVLLGICPDGNGCHCKDSLEDISWKYDFIETETPFDIKKLTVNVFEWDDLEFISDFNYEGKIYRYESFNI